MIVGISNAVNLTDGLDGLAIMPAVLVARRARRVRVRRRQRRSISNYLRIPYVARRRRAAGLLRGAGRRRLGFLWFNTYPAQVFMGDVGALALGAALGLVAVIVRQELVLLIMGGVFVVETVSVIIQVASFKTDRPAHLPHGADPPSLRAQGLGRAEGDRALLDHHRDFGADRLGELEDPLMAEGTALAAREILERLSRRPRAQSALGREEESVQGTSGAPSLIVGLGATGVSVARYLAALGERVRVIDSRATPPGLAALESACPAAEVELATLDARWLDGVSRVLLSPGLSVDIPLVAEARRRGLEVIGDVELFARAANAPVIAVTGSNGKSTVATLAAEMLTSARARRARRWQLGTARARHPARRRGCLRSRDLELPDGDDRQPPAVVRRAAERLVRSPRPARNVRALRRAQGEAARGGRQRGLQRGRLRRRRDRRAPSARDAGVGRALAVARAIRSSSAAASAGSRATASR